MLFCSIVIPVYNNQISDVKRCLDSIYQKSLNDIEILLMDDGSTRECALNLDNLSHIYPKVTVYHLPHGGAANTRNKGIAYSKGDYICFVDADDIVTIQFLSDLIAYEKSEYKYDVVYGLVTFVKQGKKRGESCQEHSLELQPIDRQGYWELYRHMFDLGSPLFRRGHGYVSRGPVARIVKRKLAEKVSFNPKLILGEDELWNLDLLEATTNLAVVYHNWYFYVENPLSTSRKPNSELIKQYRKLLLSKLPYMKKYEGKLEGAFVNRVFASLYEIIRGYYLTPLKKGSLYKNMKEFNHMIKEYPYTIITYKYAIRGGIKPSSSLL